MVEASLASWHVVRGTHADCDADWNARVFTPLPRSSPLLLAGTRSGSVRGAACWARLRRAATNSDFPAAGCGLGRSSEDFVARLSAASMSIAFFGVRRASEVAALELAAGTVDIKVRRQKNDQFGVGQFALIVSLPLWSAARRVRLLSGWMRLRGWLADHLDHAGRLAGAEGRIPLVVGSARARFGLGMAASGMTA